MKLSHIFSLVVGAAILASTSPANALNFNFTISSGSKTASGTIYGLSDNATSSASQVIVTSTNSTALQTPYWLGVNFLGLSQNTAYTRENSFTVAGGVITNAHFLVYSNDSTARLLMLNPANSSSYNGFNFFGNCGAADCVSSGFSGFTGVTYSAASAAVPLEIPGGATIPSLGGLFALGVMRKARKSVASKTHLANPVTATVS
ncbi:hypothetical protein [Halotia branconii]|uniref:PEP-CTERM sorting domain-containing protein n=1 Tax=Halotia branconii CENA392 TaxID=1539056 RepID=A0AAJ6PCH9_9CYAN|nr:hypothetical protein [Halotia branconii]WGV28994.1 hypothetical protein QI031_31025 [Halotia branconii CENA392]